jgi:hypothetical protein
MRRPFTALGNFLARDILNLTRSSLLERYTNIFIVFLVSAIFHVIVDILQSVPMEKSGSIPFYLTFVLGIMIEDGVQEIWKCKKQPKLSTDIVSPWKRAIGLLWIMLWLGVTSTWYFTPMIQSTTEDLRMVPFSVAKHVGLEPLIGVILGSGVAIAFKFEVEI